MARACDVAAEEWKSCRAKASACGSDAIIGLPTLTSVVGAYCNNHRSLAQAEMAYYAGLPSMSEAVHRASRAERPDGKRHDHQTRIRCSALEQAERQLAHLNLNAVQDFNDLHSFIAGAIGRVPGVGKLMVYDTSLRIGAKLGLEPEVVYLHAGTRAGAKALGLDFSALYLHVSDLPTPFRSLRPREIEDALCIYKRHFGRLAA